MSDQLVAETSTCTTHNTHNGQTCLRWDLNPQSQQASGRRRTAQTARPLGLAEGEQLDINKYYVAKQGEPKQLVGRGTKDTGSLPGVRRPGREVNLPPPSSAEVKESVERLLLSSSAP